MLILGITGNIGAGKSHVTSYIQNTYGGVSFRYSTMLRDVLKRIHVEETREHIQTLSTILRTHFGDDLMSKVIAKDVEQSGESLIIVEGIRRPSDVTYLKDLPGFHLIAVTADIRTRYERITKRNENADDTGKTFAQFQHEQTQEAEGEIVAIMADAEVTIDNSGSMEMLHAHIDNIMNHYVT